MASLVVGERVRTAAYAQLVGLQFGNFAHKQSFCQVLRFALTIMYL